MADVKFCHLDDAAGLAAMREYFEHDNPDLRLTLVHVDGAASLESEHGGMRVFWNFRGSGEVHVPRGFRTQEGDGWPLPDSYAPEPIDAQFAALLGTVKQGLGTLADAASPPVRAILGKHRGDHFIGDYAGELWRLDHVPRPWSSDSFVQESIERLFLRYRDCGWSVKQSDSFEEFRAGDQLIACAGDTLRVRGRFSCLAMENGTRRKSHIPQVRRLRFLTDTAGGCNPDFDPFRRLPLTWYYNYPGESGDGLNWVNSHIVNIPKETSPAHFHPPTGIGGATGIPQREMYLVLDPQAYNLNTYGREASLIVFPDLRDLRRFRQIPLHHGMFIYIPPGTGHRGLDALVNVLTIPGFKPHNEYYIDRDIYEAGRGEVPYNENHLGSRNFASLEALLL